ncbi:helix-turn-helix transcriptional regulator [Aestuariirhabdus haliotis]|uniref:helix-turn-helix transcriptional regulator n=1 Tax=Aestuariirhabdus haliotis TaxID=2918751 RepID=UPI0020C12E34|nr:helix-turn-helix transcriptional regulator [Aestuariirhabdus haliotis]MCL6421480.1 helix-turn-helix transcriptional regulator [Aestuariirhabdus haliotis]
MSSQQSEFLTTKELAELLRIKERKVYDLVSAGEVPCTRATGKLLFSRAAVLQWVASKAEGGTTQIREEATAHRRPEPPGVFLGSHDPLLEWALRESGAGLAMLFESSEEGLERFAHGEGVATGLHLLDGASQQWNHPQIKARFAREPLVLVEFARRQRGLIVSQDTVGAVQGIENLQGLTLACRQPGAGSQRLLMQLIEQAGLTPDEFTFSQVAHSEADAVLMVNQGKADAALGLQGLAEQYGLAFVPVLEERFDLLVDRKSWFEAPMQRFVRFCQSAVFSEKAREYQGYDVSGFGSVWYNG